MTHRLATNYAKNYCNRTPIVKVIVENVVTCFLGHSVVATKSLQQASIQEKVKAVKKVKKSALFKQIRQPSVKKSSQMTLRYCTFQQFYTISSQFQKTSKTHFSCSLLCPLRTLNAPLPRRCTESSINTHRCNARFQTRYNRYITKHIIGTNLYLKLWTT